MRTAVTTYNYQLEYVKNVYNAFCGGKISEAMDYQSKVAQIVASFNGEPIIPASKAVMECMGYKVGNAAFR